VNTLEEKKGEDILLMDLTEVASFTDYFVLCSGTSTRMLDGLKDTVLENADKYFRENISTNGGAESGWIVIDMGDIVVHIFSSQQRAHYQLEQLWDKGRVILRLQ
jgi:ribosome-associated protein